MNMFKISTTNSNGIYGLKRKERGSCPANSLVASLGVFVHVVACVHFSQKHNKKSAKLLAQMAVLTSSRLKTLTVNRVPRSFLSLRCYKSVINPQVTVIQHFNSTENIVQIKFACINTQCIFSDNTTPTKYLY